MTYCLFLDDEREPIGSEWFVARDFEEARAIVLAWGLPKFVSFDHDLGEGPTGKDFAEWLISYAIDHPAEFDPDQFSFDVHSQNPVGSKNIRSLIDRYVRFVREENVIDVGSAQS